MSKESFLSWLQRSRPGDRLVYFTGHLGEARVFGWGGNIDLTLPNDALDSYYQGLVDLVQRHVGSGYEYIAIRRKMIAEVPDHRTHQRP